MKFHFYFKVKREVHSHHLTFPVKHHSKRNDRLVRTGRLLVGAQLDECSVSFHREKINNRFLNGSFAITALVLSWRLGCVLLSPLQLNC